MADTITQTSILKNPANYYTKENGTNIQIKDLCPVFVNCGYETANFFNDSTKSNSLRGVSYNSADPWTEFHEFNYRKNSVKMKWVKRGTKPQFNLLTELAPWNYDTGPGFLYYKIFFSPIFEIRAYFDHYDDGQITNVSVFSMTPTQFKDKVIPKRLLMELQGAGGRGGYTLSAVNGTGGGGGYIKFT